MYIIVGVMGKTIVLNGEKENIEKILEKLKEYGVDVDSILVNSMCG